MKTASWFTKLPADHQRIGTSRGTPRGQPAGFRIYRKLAPGPWFNSVSVAEYDRLYQAEILGKLDARQVWDELHEMSNGKIPVLLCYEQPNTLPQWCHRALCAEWFANKLGEHVPEFGFEHLGVEAHPCMTPELKRSIVLPPIPDVTPFIGRTALIKGETATVLGVDPDKPGRAILLVGSRSFSTTFANLQLNFPDDNDAH
jgi:hypothetical protein